jgi:3-carboxy-cis,cis-muconate cycloisomerase
LPSDPGAPAANETEAASLFDPLVSSDSMLAATSPRAWTASLLTFERELAAAQADVGLLSQRGAEAVADATERLFVDSAALGTEARVSGNPVVPLVRSLVALAEAGGDGDAAPVHFGATSQDAMDTAAMLVSAQGCRLVLQDLDAAEVSCAELADRHRHTIMTGRTLLQPALPVPFGLKAAQWLMGLTEASSSVLQASRRLAVQLGGAAGTMAAFGDRGPALSARLAERLGLADPPLPWHTDRSRVVSLGAALVAASNAGAKVALDVLLLSQAEVGEVSETGSPGHGGSSTLPHKANAVTSVAVLAAVRRAHAAFGSLVAGAVQDHERAATGGWHAEWSALTDLLRAAGGCTHGAAAIVHGLVVHAARMRQNLDRTNGLVVAERIALDLSGDIGRAEASSVVGRASRTAQEERRSLRDVLGTMPEVTSRRTPEQLDALCDPFGYLGASEVLIERALASRAAVHGEGGMAP